MRNYNYYLKLKDYCNYHEITVHSFNQLVIPVTGDMKLTVDNKQKSLEKDMIVLLPSNTKHEFRCQNKGQLIVTDIPIESIIDIGRFPVFIKVNKTLKQYINFLKSSIIANKTINKELMFTLLLDVLHDSFDFRYTTDIRIIKAKKWIDNNFSKKFTIKYLSQQIGLSARQLNHLFHLHFGLSPHQYLTTMRMKKALELLLATSYPIRLIAEKVGYNSLSTFSVKFKKAQGKSPSKIRLSNKI